MPKNLKQKKRNYLLSFVLILLCISSVSFTQNNKKLSPSKIKPKNDIVKVETANSWKLKLDASSRYLYSKSSLQYKDRIKRNKELYQLQHFYAIEQNQDNVWTVDIFAKVNKLDASFLFNNFNFKVTSQVDDIIMGRIPIDLLPELAKSNIVESIQISHKNMPLLNKSRVEINAHEVHRGYDLPKALQGEGVIVGIVDSGIDFTHPDFYDENGSRIQYLYELTENGGANEWTKSQIDTNPTLISQRDGNNGGGHGTHVAGIAVGSGRSNNDFLGIAPKSDIIFVKGKRNPDSGGGFSDIDVVQGCKYIFTKAEELGKPSVINLSLGGHLSPHDGSSLYEQSLSNLTGPGKIIVTSIGNTGDQLIHADAELLTTKPNLGIFWATGSPVCLNAWYNNTAIDSVTIVTWLPDMYNNFTIKSYVPMIKTGERISRVPLWGTENTIYENTIIAYVTIDAMTISDPQNGDGNIIIIIEKSESVDLTSVPFAVYLSNKKTGYLDMWIAKDGKFIAPMEYSLFNNLDYFTPIAGNNSSSCISPSTAHNVISVGSYVTKNSWIDIDGYQRYWPSSYYPSDIGKLSTFSSRGPTRDGRILPDISAPGELIFSCLSSHLDEGVGYNRYTVLQGQKYHGLQGTSMAAPHVAGIVALMLQLNPLLDYEQAVSILQQTARYDSYTDNVPNNYFGYGKVDALAATQSLTANQPKVILSEGFDDDFPPQNWQHIQNSENTWFQGYFTNDTYSFSKIDPVSEYSAMCYADSVHFQEELLVSPPLNFNSNSDYVLNFYTLYHPVYQTSASIKLFDCIDALDKCELLWDSSNENDDGNGYAWRKTTVDLSRYKNSSNIQLVWQYVGKNGAFVALDGISIKKKGKVKDITTTLFKKYVLHQNYPNPFNLHTNIQYTIPDLVEVKLYIYNITGQRVAILIDQTQNAGSHLISWDGCDSNGRSLASGIYLYQLQAGDFKKTNSMVLLK